LFQTIDIEEAKNKEGEEDSDDAKDTAERMDEDLDLGTEIKDNVIPLALELYLGIVELDSDSEGDDDDSDEEMPKMPKGGKGGKKGKEDCK
jgi:hypothetical protein